VLPAPALLALAILIALVVLLPARRLHLAGLSSRAIGLYAVCLWALAMLLAFRPVLTRVLVPILLVMYLAPFVAAPGRVSGIVRRTRGRGDQPPRPPMKNVTPPPDGPTGPT
jgi:di/tricarboxylate transporter